MLPDTPAPTGSGSGPKSESESELESESESESESEAESDAETVEDRPTEVETIVLEDEQVHESTARCACDIGCMNIPLQV